MNHDLTPAEADAAVTLAAHLAAQRDAPDFASMLRHRSRRHGRSDPRPRVWDALTKLPRLTDAA